MQRCDALNAAIMTDWKYVRKVLALSKPTFKLYNPFHCLGKTFFIVFFMQCQGILNMVYTQVFGLIAHACIATLPCILVLRRHHASERSPSARYSVTVYEMLSFRGVAHSPDYRPACFAATSRLKTRLLLNVTVLLCWARPRASAFLHFHPR